MKKRFSFFLAILAFSISSHACEICGCGVGNYYIGLLPHFNHRFFGLRYHYNSFKTRLTDDPSEFSRDRFQTVELWSGWNIGKRIQLLAFVPYSFNHQVSDDGVKNEQGLGDIALLANYQVLSTGKPGQSIHSQWWVGAGLKLPTGKFAIEENDPEIASIANNQRGSGSTDIMLNTAYNLQVDKWGFNVGANYKINTANKDEYRFGNKFSANAFAYYSIPVKTKMISPNLGILYENAGHSELDKTAIELTGGYLVTAAAGVELSFNKIAIGFNAQLPLVQDFAEGQTKSVFKGMAHVSFAL